MAINIVSNITANSFLPVANPINITVNSNNTGKCNFRYVCDVLIDNVNVFRFKLFPDPNTGFAFFQLSDVINDYLKQNLGTNNVAGIYSASSTTDKTVVLIRLQFGEEYDNSADCSQPVVVFPNLAQSNQFYAYYGAFDYEEWPEYNQSDWVVENFSLLSGQLVLPKFLTKVPRGSVEASLADSYYLDFLSLASINTNTKLRIVIWKTTSNQPIILNIPVQGINSRRYRVSCGPAQINKFANDTIIDAFTTYYTVQVIQDDPLGFVPKTEEFEIRVGKPTERRKRIGFVGSLGGLEYITFFHRDRKAFTIDRKNYKSYLTSRKGNNWTYNVGDRQGTTYAVQAKEEHVVSTFVSRKTSEYLYELWLSTDVWIDDRPLTLPFRVFKQNNDMLFYLPENHGFKAGDKFFSISSDNSDFNGLFTVQSVSGRVVNVGATFNIFNLSESACGFLVKDEAVRRIPILPKDEEVEVKQKLDRPIEYTLTYSKSVDKITLRS
jgi:hypothetical protein